MSQAIYFDGTDIDKVVALYEPEGSHDASWPGLSKTTTATGSFTPGVDHRHHKIIANAITEMSAGEKTSHPLPVVDKTAAETWKTRVRLATAAALPANTRVGNVFTADVNGALPAIDGEAPALRDRILDKDNATGVDRGVKIITDLGGASSKWVMQRASDSDESAKVESRETISVAEGADNKGQAFSLDTADPIVLNTTTLTYSNAGGTIPKVAATGVVTWSAKVSGDSNNRIQISADGRVSWGAGNAAVDTFMSRSAIGTVAFGEVDGAASHSVFVYGTRSSSGVNFERLEVVHGATQVAFQHRAAGTGTSRQLFIRTIGSSAVSIATNNVTRWNVGASTGHWSPEADNAYDAGGISNRIRSIYWGTQALGPGGTEGAGTYSFAGDPDTSFWNRGSGLIAFSSNGTAKAEFGATNFVLTSDLYLGWTDATDIPSTTAIDVRLYRDSANTLAQRNGTTAQTFRVYGTFTDLSNFERVALRHDGNDAHLSAQTAGTGGNFILFITNETNQDIRFSTNNTLRWVMEETGHFTSGSDNAYDQGSASARIRSIYWGTQALGPDGTATNPSFSFVSETNTGFYWSATSIFTAMAGTAITRVTTTGFLITQTASLSWGSSGTGAPDLFLFRDAANVLAQRNGVVAQSFRIYNTFTDSSNYERGILRWSSNNFDIGTQDAGTGSPRQIRFIIAGTNVWHITTAGHLVAATDNLDDFGGPSNRIRSIYWGTQALGPDGTKASPAYSFSSQSSFGWYLPSTSVYALAAGNVEKIRLGANGVTIASDATFSWDSTTETGIGRDLFLYRDAANTLAQRNGTTAQEGRIYRTFTNSSNYERLNYGIVSVISSTNFSIVTQAAGTGTARALNLGTVNSAALNIVTSSSTRWIFEAAGHMTAGSDNAYDHGSGSARIRSIYWGTQALGPDGSAAAPSYSYGSDGTLGAYRHAVNVLGWSIAGIAKMALGSGAFVVVSGHSLSWSSSATNPGASVDLSLFRDAAAILAQKNGANAQTFRVYGNTTGSHYTAVSHDGTDGILLVNGGGALVINKALADMDTRIGGDVLSHMTFWDASSGEENIAFLATAAPNWQSMVRGLFLGNVSTAPTGNPTAGGFMYSNAGAGTWRGSGGTVTPFGAAGPHCNSCGFDSWKVAHLNLVHKSWNFECANCGQVSKGGPQSILSSLTYHQKTELVGPSSTFADVRKAMGIVS